MIALIRIIAVGIFIVILSLLSFLCLLSPGNPLNTYRFSRGFKVLRYVFNVKIIERLPKKKLPKQYIYISNHQNLYDFVTSPEMLRPNTVTIGKKSILWIPFFGFLYWVTGNILIDRENKQKARESLKKIEDLMQKKNLSFWFFPEGTRSYGKGLLPFKTGAFRMAIATGVSIVPVCVSDSNHIRKNKWNNGTVIAEMLEPIETSEYKITDAKKLANYCHEIMEKNIERLNNEVAKNS